MQLLGTSTIYRLADAQLAALLTEALAHAQHERLGLAEQAEIAGA